MRKEVRNKSPNEVLVFIVPKLDHRILALRVSHLGCEQMIADWNIATENSKVKIIARTVGSPLIPRIVIHEKITLLAYYSPNLPLAGLKPVELHA